MGIFGSFGLKKRKKETSTVLNRDREIPSISENRRYYAKESNTLDSIIENKRFNKEEEKEHKSDKLEKRKLPKEPADQGANLDNKRRKMQLVMATNAAPTSSAYFQF